MDCKNKFSLWQRYSYGWITLGLFLFSIAGHWLFGWWTYVAEQVQQHHPVQISEFAMQMTRDTFENWQSEFLQLLWQVGGLAYFLYVGSPQSEESEQRTEAKLDALIRLVGQERGEQMLSQIEAQYPR
jgi:hypothetical protein